MEFPDDHSFKVSLFKDALGQIQRLNAAWIRATRHRENGNLLGWRWILDTVYLELSYDAKRLARDKGLNYEKMLEELEKKISAAFKEKKEVEQYRLLLEKEKILRELQEVSGKGSKLVDEEEQFI